MVLLLPSGGEKKGGPDDESRIAIITENTRFALCALISWIKDRWPLTFFFFFFFFLERDQGGEREGRNRSVRHSKHSFQRVAVNRIAWPWPRIVRI